LPHAAAFPEHYGKGSRSPDGRTGTSWRSPLQHGQEANVEAK
jgi:hypothetical protein